MKKILFCFAQFLIIYLTVMIFYIVPWIPAVFGEVTFEQIVFNVNTSLGGVDRNLIYDFMKNCMLTPFVIAVGICLVLFLIYKRLNFKFSKIIIVLSICSLLVTSYWGAVSIGVMEYITFISQSSTIYEDYYVDASESTFQFPDTKRNLIFIGLESMETTYYSEDEGGSFEVNLIPELYNLAENSTTFSDMDETSGFHSPARTVWTASALTAFTLGVPLTIPIDGNSYFVEDYLGGAYGLGDILEDSGYNQSLVLGSDAAFGSRDNLFSSHGNYEITDLYGAREKGYIEEDYNVWWGYEDEILIEIVKDELLDLSAQDEPFHLFTLTADTHFEDGYLCPLCEDEHGDQYSNVLSCSSRQISELVTWIQAQDFYEDTTIVIAGDHPSMDVDFFDDIPSDYVRKQYFTIINGAPSEGTEVVREFTSFDILPTTIASLGITWEENRIGLGANLYSEEETLVEIMGIEELNLEIQKNSHYYNEKILYN